MIPDSPPQGEAQPPGRLAHLERLLSRVHRPGGMYPVLTLASRVTPGDERDAMAARIEASPLAPVWDVWQDPTRTAADRACALAELDPAHAHVHFLVADLWLRADDAHAEPFPELRTNLWRRRPEIGDAYVSVLARLKDDFDRDNEASVHRRGFGFSADEAHPLLTDSDDRECYARACIAWGGGASFVSGVLSRGELAEHSLKHMRYGAWATLKTDALATLECPELLTSLHLWGPGLVDALSTLSRAPHLHTLEFSGTDFTGSIDEGLALRVLPIATLTMSFDARSRVPFPPFIEEMPSLRELHLRYKNGGVDNAAIDLSGVRCDLPELVSLSFSGVGRLPEDLGRLTHLRSLGVRGWQLASVPPSLTELAELTELRIDPVLVLPGLPDGFDRLRSLRSLRLGHLATPELPRVLLGMPWLRRVELISARRWAAKEETGLRRALPEAYVSITFTRNAR